MEACIINETLLWFYDLLTFTDFFAAPCSPFPLMIFSLSIQPDELAEAYLGRFARINGAKSDSEIYQILKRNCYVSEDEHRRIPHFDYLSRILQISLREFTSRHTTIPFRRAIVSYDAKFAHGTHNNDSMMAYSGFRQTRIGSYFCKKCVHEDIATLGYSYWRRDHQLPGVMLCNEHRLALSYTEEKNAFFSSPNQYLSTRTDIDSAWARAVYRNRFVERYIAISRALIQQDFPFEVKKVRLVLRNQAKAKDFSTKNGECERPLISDEIVSKFPEDWLATVFPDLLGKLPGQKMHKSDGVVYLSTAASSVESYILASSILFNSADDVLYEFNSTRKLKLVTPRKPKITIDTNELKNAYVQAKGKYADLQFRNREAKWNIHNRLSAMGLPNLKLCKKYDYSKSVIAFFCEEKSMQESAEMGGVEIGILEQIIRQVGNEFTGVLRQMAIKRQKKKGSPRIKAKAPNEVIARTGT